MQVSSPTKYALDHIIILLPARCLDNLPASITRAFTITPGGTHADGKTYNRLVVLESGVYLEFIAFVNDDQERRQGHWWGRKTAGSIIDWALTTHDVKDVNQLREYYDEPRKGGRQRPDGKSVEWYVTFPKQGTERGSIPFFCHDITPRPLRVPAEGSSHPSGASGVGAVVVVVAREKIEGLASTYEKILGQPVPGHSKTWKLTEPTSLYNLAGSADDGPTIELREIGSQEDADIVRQNGGVAGVKEITLLCAKKKGEQHGETIIEETFRDAKIIIRLKY